MRSKNQSRMRIVRSTASSLVIAAVGLVMTACGNEPTQTPAEQPPTVSGPTETPSQTSTAPDVTEHMITYTGANPWAALYMLIYPVQRAGSFTLPPTAGFPPATWTRSPSACPWGDDDGVVPVAIALRPQWENLDSSPGANPFRGAIRLGLDVDPGSPAVGYEVQFSTTMNCYESSDLRSIGVEFPGMRFDFHQYIYGYVRLPNYHAPGADNSWTTNLRLRVDRVEMADHEYSSPELVDFRPYASDQPPTFALVMDHAG